MFALARHTAVVVSDDGQNVVVVLDDDKADGCAGCGIAFMCKSDACHKLSVPALSHRRYQAGEHVEVVASGAMKKTALTLFFVLPLVLMAVVAVALDALGAGQHLCALSAVGSFFAWYLVLYLFRRRLERLYRWRLVS